MDVFKYSIIAYLIYLIIDGILQLFKVIFIFAEFGLIIAIKGIRRFIKAMFQKLFRIDGDELVILDYWLASGRIASAKPKNPDISLRPISNLRLSFRKIVKPTIWLDYWGRCLTIFCAIEKGMGVLSVKDINSAVIDSTRKLGFASIYSFGPQMANYFPLLANLIRLIGYHCLLIRDAFTQRTDLYGVSAFPKIIRLVIIYMVIYFIILELFRR